MAEPARVQVESRTAWRSWLEANHGQAESIWLVTFKKAAGARHLPYDAIVEEALCFGWVDSLPRKLDAERSMLRLSPRKPGSAWSKVNKDRIARLIAEGRMHPAGLMKIEAAKADGSWSKLDGVETLEVPPDLAAAFEAHPGSSAQWAGFPPSTRRGILEWIVQAKTPETRGKRIAETARLAAQGERANQYKRKG
jgi:uncharacterized protein YdeI (YjbR/CyaY-like superfamily)